MAPLLVSPASPSPSATYPSPPLSSQSFPAALAQELLRSKWRQRLSSTNGTRQVGHKSAQPLPSGDHFPTSSDSPLCWRRKHGRIVLGKQSRLQERRELWRPVHDFFFAPCRFGGGSDVKTSCCVYGRALYLSSSLLHLLSMHTT